MPIFGSRDIFGRSRFGQANFGELSIYNLLPSVHRSLDEQEGFPARKLFKAFQEELEDLRRQIDVLPLQRDPYFANGLDYPIVLTITNAQIHPKCALSTTSTPRIKLNVTRSNVLPQNISAMMASNVCRSNVVKMQNQPPMGDLASACTFKSS